MTKFVRPLLEISDRGEREAHRRKPVGLSKKAQGNRKARRHMNKINRSRAEGR